MLLLANKFFGSPMDTKTAIVSALNPGNSNFTKIVVKLEADGIPSMSFEESQVTNIIPEFTFFTVEECSPVRMLFEVIVTTFVVCSAFT